MEATRGESGMASADDLETLHDLTICDVQSVLQLLNRLDEQSKSTEEEVVLRPESVEMGSLGQASQSSQLQLSISSLPSACTHQQSSVIGQHGAPAGRGDHRSLAQLPAHAQRLPATAAAAARAATPRAIFSSQRMRRLQMVAVRAVEAAEHTRSPDNGHPKVASPSGRVQAVAEEAMAVAAEAARSAGRRQVAKEEMKRLEGIRRLRLEERERREALREEAQRQEDDARESRRQAMIIGEPSATASSSALSPLRKARSLGGKLGGGGAAVMWPGAGFTRSRSDPGLLGPLQRRREKNYESGRMGGAKVEGFPRISRTGKVIRTTESFLRK